MFARESLPAEFEGSPFAWLRGLVDVLQLRFVEGWGRYVQGIRRRVYALENDHKRDEAGIEATEYIVAADCGE